MSTTEELYEIQVRFLESGVRLPARHVNAAMHAADPAAWDLDHPLVWSCKVMASYAQANIAATLGPVYSVHIRTTDRPTFGPPTITLPGCAPVQFTQEEYDRASDACVAKLVELGIRVDDDRLVDEIQSAMMIGFLRNERGE